MLCLLANLVSGELDADVVTLAGERTLEQQTARLGLLAVAAAREQHLAQLLVVAGMRELVYTLGHHVNLRKTRGIEHSCVVKA